MQDSAIFNHDEFIDSSSGNLAQVALQSTEIGFFFMEIATDILEYSPTYAAIICGDPQAKLSRADIIRYIHPDDELLRQVVYEQGMRTGEFEYMPRMIWADGSVHQARVRGKFGFDAAHRPVSVSGTIKLADAGDGANYLLQAAENRFRVMIQRAPVAMLVLRGEEMIFDVVNDAMLHLIGRDATIVGKTVMNCMPELKNQPVWTSIQQVYHTGEPYMAHELPVQFVKNGRLEQGNYTFSYTPLKEDGKTVGILQVASDVTTQVQTRKKVEDSERLFRSLIEEAPVATCLFMGRDLKIHVANDKILRLWGKGPEVMGQPLRQAIPELEGQPFFEILDEVFTSGKGYEARDAVTHLMFNGQLRAYYFDFTFQPLFNATGEVYAIMDMAIDVTEQVLARKKLEESELFARSILENSPVAKIVFTGEDMIMSVVNEKMLEMLDRGPDIIGQPFTEAIPELRATPLMERLKRVLATGETFYSAEEKFTIIRFGQPYVGYFNYTYKALPNTAGEFYGIMLTAVEVTEQVLARQKLEEAEETLRGAIELAELGNWSIDLSTRLLIYSDRLKSWFGFDQEETITAELAYSAVLASDTPRVQAAIARAVMPGGDGIYDVEYTCVNQKTGRERILHVQGKAAFNEQGVAYKMTGTAQDVTQQRTMQLALEQQVRQRTEELQSANEELAHTNERLQHSNEELAQYAYVASHDLQEPLRKIRIFSGLLSEQTELSARSSQLAGKINQSSARMSLLIQDLLEFSQLLNADELLEPVDLGEVCRLVLRDFELAIAEKNAVVRIGPLPVITAVDTQMNQLFYNLISNALKFSRPDVTPVLEINAELLSLEETQRYIVNPIRSNHYYHLRFSDKGIGFDEEYAEQIFEVFKRLHGKEMYPGSGIGMALCRRIVNNRRGHIFAKSVPDEGTTFHVILPDGQAGAAGF